MAVSCLNISAVTRPDGSGPCWAGDGTIPEANAEFHRAFIHASVNHSVSAPDPGSCPIPYMRRTSTRIRRRASWKGRLVIGSSRPQRSAPRLRLRTADRLLWGLLSPPLERLTEAVSIVQPATMIRWQRFGFKVFWTWRSRRTGPGRPAVAPEVRALIRQMSRANLLWGAPRIHGEFQKLGLEISQAAVSKYLGLQTKPPSQTWRTFLDNHLQTLLPWTSSSCPPCCSSAGSAGGPARDPCPPAPPTAIAVRA